MKIIFSFTGKIFPNVIPCSRQGFFFLARFEQILILRHSLLKMVINVIHAVALDVI